MTYLQTRPPWTAEDIQVLNTRFAPQPPEALLDWALATLGEDLRLACSLGLEDIVLLHILAEAAGRLGLRAKAFVLDTGRLHAETYATMSLLQERLAVDFKVYFPDTNAVETLVERDGINGFYAGLGQRKACCQVRKVEPLQRALKDAGGWITGQRRQQASSRAQINPVELDPDHGGILKLNPLASCSLEQVMAYLQEHALPTSPLHQQGFASIGCAPCTRAVQPGEDLRAGRWWWEAAEHKECGLHQRPLQQRTDA